MSRARTPDARRSVRRYTAVLTATALASVSLPMAAVLAAPTSSAELTAGQSVFPGDSRDFTINVTNARTLLGIGGGETVNYVDIRLPNTAGLATTTLPTAPAGWSVSRTSNGGIQTYTFRDADPAADGGTIAPGAALPFTFPASVAAPTADRSGTFEVAVSSDNGKTTSGAGGSLTTAIKTLQVVGGSLGASAPAGVTDQIATAGQQITYAFQVKNFARGAQTVTPSLTSSNSSDTITEAASASVPAGGTGTFSFPVTLGSGTANRAATFSAGATAGPSTADRLTRDLTVQAPAFLTLDAGSFAPRAVRPGLATTFTINGAKQNSPTLKVTSATLALPGATADGGTFSAADGTSRTLSFGPAAPSGDDGTYDVVARFSGTDDNGFPYSQELSLDDVLTLDSLGPVIDPFQVALPTDADRRQQTAASNAQDVITVSGTLSDCSPATLTVQLQPNVGSTIPVAVTRDGCDFTGSITTGGEGTTFAPGTTSFTAIASATDAAGNAGSASFGPVVVDLELPELVQAVTQGPTSSSTTADRILVTFREANTLYGACSESQWRVDGQLFVRDVLYSNGEPCVSGQAGPDNSRILMLASPGDDSLQTNVTYTPGTRPVADRATDSAGQDAVAKTVATIVGVVPTAPLLANVQRGDGAGGREDAVFDEDTYWTNNDALTAEFTGGRVGYTVRVLDEAGNQVGSKSVAGSPETVAVPIGTKDGTYTRSLQLVNERGLVSELTTFTVVLDRLAPGLTSATQTGARTVDVAFSEKIWSGSNFAEDWFVTKSNPDEDPAVDGDEQEVYLVGSVAGNGSTRTLTVNRDLTADGTAGAQYLVRNPETVRYEDRAGNQLADASI